MMNPYKVTTAVFFVALLTGGILGWTLRRPEKCPDQTTLSLRIDSLESQRDSLKATIGSILNGIEQREPRQQPETLKVEVTRWAHKLRPFDMDSSAIQLINDPK